jgi:hypothetical protein
VTRTITLESPPAHTPGCKCGRRRCKNGTRETRSKFTEPTDFIMVDGEGETSEVDGIHRYVLLSVGIESITNPSGIAWEEVCSFLYACFEESPRSAFCGYYLGYDFSQWIKTLPMGRAAMLLSKPGIAARRHRNGPVPHPVEYAGWQFDILGSKRLKIRPKPCACVEVTCKCKKPPWMYICDAGPFFQCSFLAAIDPAKWDDPMVTVEEYNRLEVGKGKRSTAKLGPEMIDYNVTENLVGARLLSKMDEGFRKMDINLKPSQWMGPGQAAQEWLKGRAPLAKTISEVVPKGFLDAAQASYYGGWFELFMHGTIPGELHEYDINSAYPDIISRLPCLEHGSYSNGTGKPVLGKNDLCLVRATVWTRKTNERSNKSTDHRYIGAMLHRDSDGNISRPQMTEGWFWWHELQASVRAKCAVQPKAKQIYEWQKYTPCDCQPPIWQIKNLYKMRLDVGKNTPLGKGARLVANSAYGKFAQSIGSPMFGNAVYASLITAGCRTQILDAIATHPMGVRGVAMVATDGVYFLTPHPTLPISKELGEWEHKVKQNVTLFKPGVYWDDETREAIAAGDAPVFKARGVNARDFAGLLNAVDDMFAAWDGVPPAVPGSRSLWPFVTFTCGFSMVTALQAVIRNAWETAGSVQSIEVTQNSVPYKKRTGVYYDPEWNVYRSEPKFPEFVYCMEMPEMSVYDCLSFPYEKRFGMDDPFSQERLENMGMAPEGPVGFLLRSAIMGE